MAIDTYNAKAHNEGFDASRAGVPKSHNPYDPVADPVLFKSWNLGWDRHEGIKKEQISTIQRVRKDSDDKNKILVVVIVLFILMAVALAV